MPYCGKCGRQIVQGTRCDQCLSNAVYWPVEVPPMQPEKKKKTGRMIVVIILIVALLAAAAVGVWLVFGNNEGRKEADPWDELAFELDGETYTLPFAYSDLLDNGFESEEIYLYDDLRAENATRFYDTAVESNRMLYAINLDRTIYCDLWNSQDETCELQDCLVMMIDLQGVEFCLPGGITQRSDLEDVQDAYGDPDFKAQSEDGRESWYYVGKAGLICIWEEEPLMCFIASKECPAYDVILERCKEYAALTEE